MILCQTESEKQAFELVGFQEVQIYPIALHKLVFTWTRRLSTSLYMYLNAFLGSQS